MDRRRRMGKSIAVVAVIVVGLCSAACPANAIKNVESLNPEVKVELLTSFDGVRLYRVDTGVRTVYVAVSSNRLEVAWDSREGKTTVPVEVQTIEGKK